jgi:iron complex outermembrane receptor protein
MAQLISPNPQEIIPMRSILQQFSSLHRVIATISVIAVSVTALAPVTASAALEEMIVTTARGRQEAVQDVPASVAVISQKEIEAVGIQRVEDIVNQVPGVSIVNAAEVADTQVNIRGINGARDAETNYALIIDGILMTNPAALNREYTNLQQIEVLKGPQGALYGRNAAAGAIIITTQKPGEEFGAAIKGSAAEDSSYYLTGHLGGPIGDTLGWSVNADYRTSDGFRKDVFNGTDDTIDNFENWNVGGRLIWDATDDLSFDTKFRYGEVDAASITFNSVFHLPAFPGFLESLGIPAETAAGGNQNVNDHVFQFNPNMDSFNNQEALELSVKADWDLGWADLGGWFLYSDIDNNLGSDGTSAAFGFFWSDPLCRSSTDDVALSGFQLGIPQVLVPQGAFGPGTGGPEQSVMGAYLPTTCDGTQYQERNQEDYSFELRLASKDDQRLRWSAGLYYLNIDREVGVNLGIDTGQGIVESLFTTDSRNPTEQLAHDDFKTDVYAAFGQLAWDLTDAVEISAALRYDREEREAHNLVPTSATTQFLVCDFGDPFTGGAPINAGLCEGPIPDKAKNFDQWQPKASVTADITKGLMTYASVGVGFKSGGFNNAGSAATVNEFINEPFVEPSGLPVVGISDEFRQETSTSYELGFKSQIGDKLRWEGALYAVRVDNMQFFEFFVGQFGLLRVVSNIDDVKIQGAELSGVWSVTDWLDLYGGGNIIDTEITQNSSRPDTIGNKSPYTPDYTYNGGASIDFPMTSRLRFIGNLNVTGVGATWFHVVQKQQRPTIFSLPSDFTITERDSYTLVDARIGVAGDNWSVVAFGKNIFDEDYLEEVIPAPEFGGTFDHPGTQSRFGLEASFSF